MQKKISSYLLHIIVTFSAHTLKKGFFALSQPILSTCCALELSLRSVHRLSTIYPFSPYVRHQFVPIYSSNGFISCKLQIKICLQTVEMLPIFILPLFQSHFLYRTINTLLISEVELFRQARYDHKARFRKCIEQTSENHMIQD